MKIIKRSGTETVFDITKITAAITKANKEIPTSDRLSLQQIQEISDNVEQMCLEMRRSPSVEEIQACICTGAKVYHLSLYESPRPKVQFDG